MAKKIIDDTIVRLNKNYEKYFIKNKVFLIHYEKLNVYFLQEFEKIIRFLNMPWNPTDANVWNPERAELIHYTLTKEAIINSHIEYNKLGDISPYINRNMLTESYEIKRQIFINKWGDYINRALITTELEKFFHIDCNF